MKALKVLNQIFKKKLYCSLSIATFIFFFILYIFVLPGIYTGGRIGLISLKFLNLWIILFSLSFSLTLSLIVPANIYIIRNHKKSNCLSCASAGILSSILPPILCCTSLLPTLAISFGLPFLAYIQGFLATYKVYIFLIAILLLVVSLIITLKTLNNIVDIQ